MGLQNSEILDALDASAKELQQSLDLHCYLVSNTVEARADDRILLPFINQCPKRSRTFELKETLKEAIVVLVESRKAFKSKRLEALRKKLTQVLIDADYAQEEDIPLLCLSLHRLRCCIHRP